MVHIIQQQKNTSTGKQEQLTVSECLLITEAFAKRFTVKICLMLFTTLLVRYRYDLVL